MCHGVHDSSRIWEIAVCIGSLARWSKIALFCDLYTIYLARQSILLLAVNEETDTRVAAKVYNNQQICWRSNKK
jgi:hypothetical protein